MIRFSFSILLLLFTLSNAFSQVNDFDARWKKVESFDAKGLTQSALSEVVAIYQLALSTGNVPQQIKSAMYQVKYRNLVEEDNQEKNIRFIDSLISKSRPPARNILQSMQAELFWRYKQNNRWKFYNRTPQEKQESNDISTWSIQKLNEEISRLYRLSISAPAVLKSTPVKEFETIIQKGENTRHLRPTLYDFLAFRALEFFTNDEHDVVNPAYKFIINDERYFAPASEFVKLNLSAKDSSSLFFQALLLFQHILHFHLDKNEPAALIDADIQRLEFVNSHGSFSNKQFLFEQALWNLEIKYPANPEVAQASYLRARIYFEQGSQYKPNADTSNRYKLVQSKKLSDSIYNRFPAALGGINAKNLSYQITTPSVDIKTEKVNIPETPFRALVSFKNFQKIYFKLIRIEVDELHKTDFEDQEAQWKKLFQRTALKSWEVTFPSTNDYQEHSAEIKIDGLKPGIYYLLSSLDKNFSFSQNILTRQAVYVSNISVVNNQRSDYYVLNRETGRPLEAAQVQVWNRYYDYTTRKYEYKKEEKFTTGNDGHFSLPESKEYRSFQLQVTYKNDELFNDDDIYRYYSNYYTSSINQQKQTFIFTDRSIYRPGQTVFFKGIVVATDSASRKSMALADFKTTVILTNANSQQVATAQLTTNKFGSYSGSFQLPEGTLNGQFYLTDSATRSVNYISVEEYKRPKFHVDLEQPTGTYRLNDSITVKGVAEAYAGNSISQAKVTYRVVRKVNFYPLPYYSRKIWPPFSREEMEITNGITLTNEKGEFRITFKAIPDESIDRNLKPVFNYEVIADVIDINGETRSASKSVAVAWHNLKLSIQSPEKIIATGFDSLNIQSRNINEVFVPTAVTLTMARLSTPGKILRERYWTMPDQFILTAEEFRSYFPNDPYKDENLITTWPVESLVLNQTDTTRDSGAWKLPIKQFQPGWYKIAVTTTDKNGIEVADEKYIELTDLTNNYSVINPLSMQVSSSETEPGKNVNAILTTGFDEIYLVRQINRVSVPPSLKIIPLQKNKSEKETISVSESDRGGIQISYVLVKNNRVYTGSETVEVPWSNKELQISLETFRDKLTPGSKENWKVKIAGNKGEAMAAELLANMYDASLDQFKPHNWTTIKSIWPHISSGSNWNGLGFTDLSSEELLQLNTPGLPIPTKMYDRLLPVWENYYYTFAAGNVAYAETGVVQEVTLKRTKSTDQPMADERQANVTTPEKRRETDDIKVQIRKNFNETAFFLPQLTTETDGTIGFNFTMPEALTQWKLMMMAHSRDLASSYVEKKVITQKELMVQPNMPRFIRHGDHAELPVKIVNLSDKELTGTVQLELFDAATNKSIDGWFKNIFPTQYFTVEKGSSQSVVFPVDIPFGFTSVLGYRFIAKSKAGNQEYSDGEENALPVLSNRMLVTESMPLNLRNMSSKTYRFDKLLNSGNSGTLTHQALTVTYATNPTWYVVQALPYLKETEHESVDQYFNRYYSVSLASYIANSYPGIRKVFEQWKTNDTSALISNLSKNEELKSILLQETPWVLAAADETTQKKNIALLFDLVKISNEKDAVVNKLIDMQSPNGGFTWMKGGPDDRFMTQNILTGIGHLIKLQALTKADESIVRSMISKALNYADKRIKEDYDYLVKQKIKLDQNNLTPVSIQYLYLRTFFSNEIPSASKKAFGYFSQQIRKYWLSQPKNMQAMIALTVYRNSNSSSLPKNILNSLKQNAIVSEEMGMYWKDLSSGGYYWYQAPVEAQALMIEAFTEIENNPSIVNDLRTWLLKQKQTQHWPTGKSTADACYALLLNKDGHNKWLDERPQVTIQLGNTTIRSNEDSEAGTGYFKQTIPGDKVQQGMGNIHVRIDQASSGSTSWGAVYWQYFEEMDKITSAATPLSLVKKLFVEKNSDKGPVLVAVKDGDELHIGDKVKVRIELRVDRNMEYIHMKDMRASAMEPVNVITTYQFREGLGYYESTKDISTHFFFSWLPRGTYVFEYPLYVTQAGNFSNGITIAESLYAPEFSSHSEGIRISVSSKKQQ